MGKRLAAICLTLAFLSVLLESAAFDKTEIGDRYREGESAFRQGTEFFDTDPVKARGLLEKAALCFEAVHREGNIENGNLFYNLGNIYFRLTDVGRAILNYRRAERFIPNDTNLQQNLNYARSRCTDKIEPMPQTQVFRTLFFWHYDLPGPVRALALRLLLRHALVSRFPPSFPETALAPLSPPVLCVDQSFSRMFARRRSIQRVAYPFGRDPGKRGSWDERETAAPSNQLSKIRLHAGTEFNLVEDRNGWLHIELADGRRCWIPKNAAGII